MKRNRVIIIIIVLLLVIILGCFLNSKINKTQYLKVIERKTITGTIPYFDKIYSKFNIDKTVNNILKNYADLNNILIGANVKIPNENGFIPQGITLMNDYILFTGYYEDNQNSKCYVYDDLGNLFNVVTLDIASHVGAIAYDKANELIWIPDNHGTLNAYDSKEFLTKKEVSYKYHFDNISDGLTDYQDSNDYLIAYLYIDDNYLYIGNFFVDENSLVKKYEIIASDHLELKYINSFYVPKRTQGLSFMEKNGIKYMLLSNSYRRRNPSYIYLYTYDENLNDYVDKEIVKLKTPPMLEQVWVEGKLMYLVFESNAKRYWDCPEKIGYVLTGNLNGLLNYRKDG